MNICNETEQLRHVLAIGIWEDEGGAPGRDPLDLQYGRRIEADRSWTVYHVFTGVPAYSEGQTMTGLSRPHATDRMLSLNRDRPHKHRCSLAARARPSQSTTEDGPS